MLDLLNALDEEFLQLGKLRITNETWFEGIKRAAIIKTFEFCVEVYKEDKDSRSFFLAPALRGTCEDLIAIAFLQKLPEKEQNTVTLSRVMTSLFESSEKQKRFFNKEHSWQPVVTFPNSDERKHDYEEQLKYVGHCTGFWHKNRTFPSVYQMSKEVSLNEIYDFVYNITSDIVHFNPRILLRMGWGENDPSNVQFSTENFSGYYSSMCRTYGLFLLLYQVRLFELSFSEESKEVFSRLEAKLHDVTRWPESVTFEEINAKPPSDLSRILLRVAHELEDEAHP